MVVNGLSERKRSKIVLKDRVTEIAPTAFWGECFQRTVIIPGNLQKIGTDAFDGSRLPELKCNGVISQIGESAFYGFRLSLSLYGKIYKKLLFDLKKDKLKKSILYKI